MRKRPGPVVKKDTSVRLSRRAVELLDTLTAHYGLSQQGVIELLVRRCFRTDCGDLKDPTIQRAVSRAREASSPMPSKTMGFTPEVLDMMDLLVSEYDLPGRAEVIESVLLGAALAEGI